jgi:hypothetical protein
MELISRCVFGIASAVLMLIALALSVYSGGLILAALRGPWAEAGAGLLESIGYVVIAVAVFDVAKYFVEEKSSAAVRCGSRRRRGAVLPSSSRRSRSRCSSRRW